MKRMKVILLVSMGLIILGAVLVVAAHMLGARFSDAAPGLSFSNQLIKKVDRMDYTYEIPADGKYTVSDQDITSIEVRWISGSVNVVRSSDGQITFQERSRDPISDGQALRWGVEQGKLMIYDTDKQILLPEKTLTLSFPDALVEELRINTTSASVSLEDVQADSIDIETTSGDVRIWDTCQCRSLKAATTSGSIQAEGTYQEANLKATSGQIVIKTDAALSELELTSTSGAISFNGAFRVGDIETTSGNIWLTLTDAFREAEVDSTSGTLTICQPDGIGYWIDYSGTGGKLITDEPIILQGDDMRIGSGRGKLSFETNSGDLKIEVQR